MRSSTCAYYVSDAVRYCTGAVRTGITRPILHGIGRRSSRNTHRARAQARKDCK
jgi:hypothetical protein